LELIVTGAALAVGVLLVVLGRRGRKRAPEGSVFDAAGASRFRSRRPAGSGADPGRGRLGDLGRRRPPTPVAEPPGGPAPTAPAPARPLSDATPLGAASPGDAAPLGEAAPPAWPVAAPPPDWSRALSPSSDWSGPAGSTLAEAKERAERALQAERREREKRGRRPDEPADDT
jgi:hypothetical protein